MNIYPIELHWSQIDVDEYSHADPLVRIVWLRLKPKDIKWYGVSGRLYEGPRLVIDVYNRRYSWYEGWNLLKIATHEVTEFTTDELNYIRTYVLDAQLEAAQRAYDDRIAAERSAAVEAIRKELFGESK